MSDILTKKIYSKNKDTGVQTQVYPETNPASVVGLENYVDGRIANAANFANNEGHLPLSNFDFAGDHSSYDGTYIITGGVNSPFGGEYPGVMTFSAGSGSYIETWHSASYVGYRKVGNINPIEAGIDDCTINNVKIDTSVIGAVSGLSGVSISLDNIYGKNGIKNVKSIHLASGGTYTISGALTNTRICLDEIKKNSTTTLILNGLYVHFNDQVDVDDEENGEGFVDASETMLSITTKDATGKAVIKLAEGSKNYFVRDIIEGTLETITHPTLGELHLGTINSSSSVIYNEGKGSLDIVGSGYLSIFSLLGGHAIKAKGTLNIGGTVDGDPVIRATAYHDILHGNGNNGTDYIGVNFKSGHVYCDYCNDFFGTNTADGDQKVGHIYVYSGDFTLIKCEETFLQADSAVIYPGVTIKYKDVGEGLWLQAKEGFTKVLNGSGLVNKYYTVDYIEHKFILTTLVTPLDYFAPEASQTNIVNQLVNKTETYDLYEITVYDGVVLTALENGTYTESGRNLPRLADALTSVPVGGLQNEYTTAALAEPLPAQETFTYSQTMFGGSWTIGVTETGLSAYKALMEYTLKNISTMIIPPKAIIIRSKQDYTDAEHPGEIEELVAKTPITYITKDKNNNDVVNTAVDTGEYPYSSKLVTKYTTGDYPTFNNSDLDLNIRLCLGETIRLKAELDPLNTTNSDIKWTTVGLSEKAVFSRMKEDDLRFCRVQGLAVGTEDLKVSAKALDKSYNAVVFTIHFNVVRSTITFDANGGSGEMSVGQAGDDLKYTLPACTFTAPAGLYDTFCGWIVDGELLEPETVIEVRKDTVIKAAWGTNGTRSRMLAASPASGDEYTITFAPYKPGADRTAKGTMASVTGISGAYALPECEFEPWFENEEIDGQVGYWQTAWDNIEFNGWSIDDGNEQLPAGIVIEIDADTTLTAVFGPRNPGEPGM